MPTMDDFTSFIAAAFADATNTRHTSIILKSGDIHRKLGSYPGKNHQMPSCCNAMIEAMKAGDDILHQPPKGKGANLIIKYRIPR
jgi:hypothetical protein